MTKDEIQQIAREAGREGAQQVLMALGIDMSDASQVRDARGALAWADEARKGSAVIRIFAFRAFIGVIITGIALLIWRTIEG